MSIELLAIKFNHDAGSADQDALNIRRNASTTIAVPEWVRGMTKPEDSLAAYSIRETKNKTVTIQAKFARLVPTLTKAEVRAIQQPPPPPPKGWYRWLLELLERYPWLWHVLLFLFYRGVGKNILGMVKAKEITFGSDGESGYETFELDKHWLQKRGVHRAVVKWRWEFRLGPGQAWTSFATSQHQIYTVLEIPKDPWKQRPYPGTQNPWTDVLDFACDWAAFHTDKSEAAGAVTEWVNAGGTLSGPKLTYDTANGKSHYTQGSQFLATQFIAYLRTGASLGNLVNCTDCATIVTTFANALGCDLMASRMSSDSELTTARFDLNFIFAIGQSTWGCPFGCRFRYHEVAWTGSGSHTDPLFDACLRVDGDDDPWSAALPHAGVLPNNMAFSTLKVDVPLPIATPFTAKSYRERLCANNSAGIGSCKAIGAWPGTHNGRREVI
jgi:hypothetical protein